jgi:hypothetical protein
VICEFCTIQIGEEFIYKTPYFLEIDGIPHFFDKDCLSDLLRYDYKMRKKLFIKAMKERDRAVKRNRKGEEKKKLKEHNKTA